MSPIMTLGGSIASTIGHDAVNETITTDLEGGGEDQLELIDLLGQESNQYQHAACTRPKTPVCHNGKLPDA